MDMDIHAVSLEQLSYDYCVDACALAGGRNLFALSRNDARRRPYLNGEALNVLCMGGICAFCTRDLHLLDALRARYADAGGEWFLESDSLHGLDELLSTFGMRISSHHLYFLPATGAGSTQAHIAHDHARALPYEIRWYDAGELKAMAGDPRFDEALAGSASHPDELGAAALYGGRILGMAAASRDSGRLWQIGINVEPDARGRGIATHLVALLKDALMARGIVPFYGTAFSHIASQRTAISAGFTPAWAELSARAIGQ